MFKGTSKKPNFLSITVNQPIQGENLQELLATFAMPFGCESSS
jgi:hypothetical protein